GLVWNNAKLVGDGVGERRMAGLTDVGYKGIECCNAHVVLIEGSHMDTAGFRDIIEKGDRVVAYHSNAREVFDQPRNLDARQHIEKVGMINIVFNPPFIKDGSVSIEDLFPHIDRIIELGGSDNIGIGSDFDGIGSYVDRLQNAGDFPNLTDALDKRYGSDFT